MILARSTTGWRVFTRRWRSPRSDRPMWPPLSAASRADHTRTNRASMSTLPPPPPPSGVVAAAQGRLAEVVAGKCFTSDLSINEFLLVGETGFEPVSLVVGSSMYHVGIQVARGGQSQELSVLSQAMSLGRQAAMQRMVAEATAVAADGVVGVRLALNMF